jgi:LacI family transcriptional regulator
MPSITRIAEAANVSYTTAWRIINNRPCGSEDAVAKVKAAMQKMNYQPQALKRGRPPRAIQGIRSHNIVLLHLREGTSISTSVLSAVHEALARKNLNLIFAQFERADALPQALRAGNVDGILGYGELPPQMPITPALRRVPAVWMMSRGKPGTRDPWGDRVKPDNEGIGLLAADHLVARGHRNVAFFNPQPGVVGVYTEREAAFRSSAQGRARTVHTFNSSDARQGLRIPGMERAAASFVEQWLRADPRPTGVFVPVDRVTLRVCQQLARNGVTLGKDLEIISCDNEQEMLSLIHPTPASIDINRPAIAQLAVERLLWRMTHGISFPSVVLTVSPSLPVAEPAKASSE